MIQKKGEMSQPLAKAEAEYLAVIHDTEKDKWLTKLGHDTEKSEMSQPLAKAEAEYLAVIHDTEKDKRLTKLGHDTEKKRKEPYSSENRG